MILDWLELTKPYTRNEKLPNHHKDKWNNFSRILLKILNAAIAHTLFLLGASITGSCMLSYLYTC